MGGWFSVACAAEAAATGTGYPTVPVPAATLTKDALAFPDSIALLVLLGGSDGGPVIVAGAVERAENEPVVLDIEVVRARGGFSLLELLVVLAVVGVVAAVGAPRLSRGSASACDSALKRDLHVLRKAIDLYAVEHGGRPPSAATFRDQLRRYTDAAGNVSKTRVAPYIYGRYLRSVPAVAAGPSRGSSKVAAAGGPGVGWIYDEATGEVRVNASDETDAAGFRYADY